MDVRSAIITPSNIVGVKALQDILKYIHNNIASPLSASEIAQKYGYSLWHFCEKFRLYTGRTFTEYVRHYRMNLSALDILSGRKVLETALAYGYENAGGFNKAFRKEFGCSPNEYKKQAKESQLYYEKRRLSMFQLTDRCAELREEAVNQKRYARFYDAQRNIYTYIGQSKAMRAGLTNTEIIAAGIAQTLESFNPVIIPGEIVVGFNFSNEPDYENIMPCDDEAGRAVMRDNGVSQEDMALFFSFRADPPTNPNGWKEPGHTETEIQLDQEWAGISRGIDGDHSVIGYEMVLKRGFSGLLEDIAAAEEKNGQRPMYTAMRSICKAACKMGNKYVQKAQALLEAGDPAYNRVDLQQIIATCSNVPYRPAATFLEAVQALWFAHIINAWEDYVNANSLGRLDQILYPYYQADIEKGTLTKEEAFEIICCLWLKLYRDYDVQQSCVGGTHSDGSSAVNDLSYLMLDATEQLDFIRCLSVRYSSKTEKAFLKRALEVVGHVQKGVPFFFSDDIMIPALEAKGIRHEDACDYTQLGCVETAIPGKSNPHAVTGEVNVLKAIEYILGNGNSLMYPEFKTGLQLGSLEKYKTFDLFYADVLKQIAHLFDLTCGKVRKDMECSRHNAPKPYKSLLTEGCLESGRDFNDEGALYDYYQIMICGIPNLADSLAVIKKFVFEDKKYTLSQLKDILVANFPDEATRLSFVNKAPKYGNDIDEVDLIAADIMDKSCDMLDRFSDKYGISFHAQPFTYLWMIDHGNHCAASPDGRRKGDPIAYSCSSMQGRDFNGLTALFNSIAKLPSYKAPGTTSAIVEVDPKLFCDRNIDTMTDIFIAASNNGLCNVQFNIIDADTLIDAQKHPEKYNNLAVRVSGFSQKFNLLTPELQNHIIGRTKHTCL